MSRLAENVRLILAHLKREKKWSGRKVADQVWFFSAVDRDRFYKWIRKAKSGAITRPHTSTAKFERALRWVIHASNNLFETEPDKIKTDLNRFDLMESLQPLLYDDDRIHVVNRFVQRANRNRGTDAKQMLDDWDEQHGLGRWSSGSILEPTGKTPVRRARRPQPIQPTSARIVKWTGSKRQQAAEILRHLPSRIETYYEPFLGGASVLFAVLSSPIDVKRLYCSDLNASLIGIWNLVKDDPHSLLQFYDAFWQDLHRRGSEAFYETREGFNDDHDPLKLFCLLRTCRNGFVRFNKRGEFNSGLHLGRKGIRPDRLLPIVQHWSSRLNVSDVQFEVKDFRSIDSRTGDFMYLDPPYSEFDFPALWEWLERQRGSYALSLAGFRGDEDRRIEVPRHLYNQMFLIENPNAFHRMTKNKRPARDCLYVKTASKVIDAAPATAIAETKKRPSPAQLVERILNHLKERAKAEKEARPHLRVFTSNRRLQNILRRRAEAEFVTLGGWDQAIREAVRSELRLPEYVESQPVEQKEEPSPAKPDPFFEDRDEENEDDPK